MDAQQNEERVVKLVDAGVPADHGLSSLGLLMQLAGNVMAAYAGIVAFVMMLAMRARGEMLWVFVVMGMCIARSLMHRAAGTQLLYGNGAIRDDGKVERFAGVRTYIIFAASQSLALGALLAGKFEVPPTLALGVTVGLALWPAALFVLFRLPRFARYRQELPVPEDKGFEGASILMTVLGLCGLVAVATLMMLMLDAPGRVLASTDGFLIFGVLVLLVIRSCLHVQAGLSGLRETNIDRSVELASRYANFGMITAFCAGAALLVFFMMLPGARMNAAGFAMCVGITWLLMAWPLTVRRFFAERQFADLMAGDDAPIHRRAPDAGITGLGWLLFAYAMFSAVFVIIGLAARGSDGLLGAMMTLGGSFGMRSMWFSVGLVILQGWAGYELIRMSAQARIVATVYGVVGVIVTIYMNMPLVDMFRGARGAFRNAEQLVALGPIAIALIIPIATLILVNRNIAPTARARFRPRT